MDLSFPVNRQLANSRSITCNGYERDDGLWDIEAHLVDLKSVSLTHPKVGRTKPAGVPLHEMKIRITVDTDMLIHGAEAVTIHAPFTPCAKPPLNYEKLKGISLNKGWKKAVSEIIGGTAGCTHLLGLMNVVVNMAYQTIASSPEFMQMLDQGEATPFFINTCYSFKTEGEVVKLLFPEYYTPNEKSPATE